MARIVVTNVEVLDNPSKFTNPFQFEIIFDCIAPGISSELEWKLLYVGSAEDEKYDQELDSILVGPVEVGTNKFVFQAPAPDPANIPEKDLLEVTVILLTCSYLEQEFIRIGYYVNNDYGDNKVLNESPPEKPSLPDMWRHILADQPRVTRIQINWNEKPNPNQPVNQQVVEKSNQSDNHATIMKDMGLNLTSQRQDQKMGDEDDDEMGDDGDISDVDNSVIDLLDGEESFLKNKEHMHHQDAEQTDVAMNDG